MRGASWNGFRKALPLQRKRENGTGKGRICHFLSKMKIPCGIFRSIHNRI